MEIKNLLTGIKVHQYLIGKYPLTQKEGPQYIRDLSLATIAELFEFLNEVPWKPWKPIEKQKLNINNARAELIDVFIFVLDLWLIFDPKSEINLANEIQAKIIKNIDRLKTNEHKTHIEGETNDNT